MTLLPLWEKVDRMSVSSFETDEGSVSTQRTPHPPSLRSGTFSHKGRREGEPQSLNQPAALTSSANRCQISGRQLPLAAPEVDGNIQTLVSPISSGCSP